MFKNILKLHFIYLLGQYGVHLPRHPILCGKAAFEFIWFSPSTLRVPGIKLRSWELPLPAELSPQLQFFLSFFFIFDIFILIYIKIRSYLPPIFPLQLPPTSPTLVLSASCLFFFFDDPVSPVCSAHSVWV